MQVQPKQFNLMQYIENRFNEKQWSILAIADYLESHFPGAMEEIKRREFYYRCWSFMMGREITRKKATPEDVLVISIANVNVIDKLRKEAIAQGWMDEFHRAELNVKHELKEM
jgi:hypothetical protein